MPEWWECLLRMLMAIGLGFAIGIERQLSLKVAGIRIHSLVAGGAALFTVISKYAFFDSESFNAAQVAAQIVTGIGFLGAGMILHRQNAAVHGLSSAAAIWATAAIGMAAGAGMYWIALGAAGIMIVIQLIFHIPLRIFKEKHYNEIKISYTSTEEDCSLIVKKLFNITSFTEFRAERTDGEIVYFAVIHTKMQIDATFIRNALNEYPFILYLEKTESDR